MLSVASNGALALVIVRLCQLAILVVGAIWMVQGVQLGACVALVALVLTTLPARWLSDPRLRNTTSAITASLLAAHIVFGMHAELYETSLVYDKLMHVIGSAAVALIVIEATRVYCHRHRLVLPDAMFLLVAFCATLSAGALWEIFEFGVDRTGLFVAQRGLTDTMIDLIADALGAALVLITIGEKRC